MKSLNYRLDYLHYLGTVLLVIYAVVLYICGLVVGDELFNSLAQVLLIVTSISQLLDFNTSLNEIDNLKDNRVIYVNK